MDTPSQQDELIEHTYAVALEPERYDALLSSWERYVDVDTADTVQIGQVQAHFDRAHALLSRIGRTANTGPDIAALVEDLPGGGLICDIRGRVIAYSGLPREAGPEVAPHLGDALGDEAAATRIMAWMVSPLERASRFLFVQRAPSEDAQSACVFVMALDGVSDGRETDDELFIVSNVDLTIDEHTIESVKAVYGLSTAEAEVTIGLASGLSPKDIAKQRGASINTVRTQIKQALAKAGVSSVTDLVRLVCSFAANRSVARLVSGRDRIDVKPHSHRRDCMVTLRDGRRLAFMEQGDPNGTPVLFVHGMLWGGHLPDSAVASAASKGWRIISPSRPGFGTSAPRADLVGDARVEATAADFVELLDHLGIAQCFVIGHTVGSVYAQRFTIRYPQRVRGLLFASHATHWRDRFLAQLPPRQRIIARTSRTSSAALKFIVRAGVALIDSGREDQFLLALNRHIPADMRAMRRPDVMAAVIEGVRHTVVQGADAFCADCPIILTDWSADMAHIKVPVRMFRGVEDMTANRNYFSPYLARFGEDAMEEVPGAGQYVIYSHWPRLFANLTALSDMAN